MNKPLMPKDLAVTVRRNRRRAAEESRQRRKRLWREQKKRELRCFWTRPWGHVWEKIDGGHRCMSCGLTDYPSCEGGY